MLMLLTACLFFLTSFTATDQSITQKEKPKCIFSNPSNLPCVSRKIYSLRAIAVLQSQLSTSSGADCTGVCQQCHFTSATLEKAWLALGLSAGIGAASQRGTARAVNSLASDSSGEEALAADVRIHKGIILTAVFTKLLTTGKPATCSAVCF